MTASLSARMVLLRHDLPDGTWHYDWLFEHPPAKGLLAWQTRARPDDPACQEFLAHRLPEHRAVYLEYQGPIGPLGSMVPPDTPGSVHTGLDLSMGARGRVTRVASGWCSIEQRLPGDADSDWRITAMFAGAGPRVGISPDDQARWRASAVPTQHSLAPWVFRRLRG